MQEIDYDSLIQKAHNAFQNGNKSSAYDYAQAAVEKMPDSEQAWLILASLSEGEQSLRYLESALRANPESQAARKAIRLVVNQMASKKEEKENPKNQSRAFQIPPQSTLRNQQVHLRRKYRSRKKSRVLKKQLKMVQQ